MLSCFAVFSSSFCASSGVNGVFEALGEACATATGDGEVSGLTLGEGPASGLGEGVALGSVFFSELASEIIFGANGLTPAAACGGSSAAT